MTWLWVAIMVALNGAAGLVGAVLPERWLERHRDVLLGFAAGALLASGVGELMPEAIALRGPRILGWSLGAIALLAAFEWCTARRRRNRPRTVVPIALLGSDALHNIGDGMAIASAFLVSLHLGFVTAIAVIAHELPEEIAAYALLRASGVSRRKALLALGAVQLTAGLGAAGTLLASSLIADAEAPILAIAGGMFFHIAALHLLPDVLRARRWPPMAAFVTGTIAVLAFW